MLDLRRFRFVFVLVLLAGVAAWVKAQRTPEKLTSNTETAKPAKLVERADANDLYHEVTVLQVLYNLQATPAQLQALARLAGTTAPKPGPRKVIQLTDNYYKALGAFRQSLVEGEHDKIQETAQALDTVQEDEFPDFDEVELTEEARKEAPGLLRKFSARQMALYVAGSAEEFPDPETLLLFALERARELTGRDWRELRDDVAYQIGWLVAGVDEAAEKKVSDEVTALLDKAHKLDAKAYKEQRANLEKAAQELLGRVGPADVLRHYMERTLAEILSNPRLAAAVQAKLNKEKGK